MNNDKLGKTNQALGHLSKKGVKKRARSPEETQKVSSGDRCFWPGITDQACQGPPASAERRQSERQFLRL